MMDLQQSAIIRAIFKGREWIMGSHASRGPVPHAFLAQMRRSVGANSPKFPP
jgi:hypothetical protein